MNSKIFSTLMMALHDYKRNWNDKRTDDKYGPVPSDCQEIINKQIEKIDESMSYVRSIPIEDEPKSLNPLCEFMRFFQFSDWNARLTQVPTFISHISSTVSDNR